MEKVLYFGYGANRDPKMMEWITGNSTLKGKPGILKGYKLCVQRLDQIPDTVAETAPAPVSPKAILKDNWGDGFTSYIIKPDEDGKVYGTIWELGPRERDLVREWELIDFGWYKDIKAKAITEDGAEVEIQTEGLRPGQGVDREIIGEDYETWLNKPEDFKRHAEKSRQEYLERLAETPEGVRVSGETKA